MKTTITGHMIVKNEEQWVWYAIQSVLPYVDTLLIYDTGSTDKTVAIIRSITNSKIVFEQKGKVDTSELVRLRNEQLKRTKTFWFLLIDGDEVWPEKTAQELSLMLQRKSQDIVGVVVPAVVPVGDLYHYQSQSAGKYQLLGKRGHMNLRVYRKVTTYTWKGMYPLEAYVDEKNIPIQNKEKQLIMLHYSYWHLTHLKRSSQDTHGKRKLEIGKLHDISFPEVFFKKRPNMVPSPWHTFTPKEKILAHIITPILHIKRKLT